MYHGDIRLGETIDIKFTTVSTAGAPTQLAGSPVVSAYVDNGTTQLTAGITLTADFDSVTGLNNVRVVATAANGYARLTNVQLVVTTGTVGGASIAGYVIGTFSIECRNIGQLWRGTLGSAANTSVTFSADPGVSKEAQLLVQLVGGTDAIGKSRYITYSGAGEVWTVDPAWNSGSPAETLPSGTLEALLFSVPKTPTTNVPQVALTAASLAQVNTEVDTAFADYDPSTIAQVDAFSGSALATLAKVDASMVAAGTIGATGNDTTHLHLTGLAHVDDALNNLLIVLKDVSTGLFHARWISDFANTGDLATLHSALPVTPENSVDTYQIMAIRRDVDDISGTALDARGITTSAGVGKIAGHTLTDGGTGGQLIGST